MRHSLHGWCHFECKQKPSFPANGMIHTTKPVAAHVNSPSRLFDFPARKWNTSKVSMYDVVALFRINIEASLMDPLVQLNGIRIIFDFDGLSMSHVAQASPKHAMVSLQWIQKCCPLQLKSIHIVNNSMLFNVLFTIFKPFISKELRDKMHFHNRDYSSLTKCISAKCLPPAYGGTLDAPECEGQLLGDFMQLYDKHYEAMDAFGYDETSSK